MALKIKFWSFLLTHDQVNASSITKITSWLKFLGKNLSGIPEAETFGRNRKFSAFGFRFRPPKVKAEYGRNSRKALDFFFPSVFQDEVLMAWFSLSVF